jgi:hypothetical protein
MRMALGACALQPKTLFCDFFVKKARDFNTSLGGNSTYKYRIPHSQFSGLE